MESIRREEIQVLRLDAIPFALQTDYILDHARFAHCATACGTHPTFATIHRKVAIRPSRTGLFESRYTKIKRKPYLTARFPFNWRHKEIRCALGLCRPLRAVNGKTFVLPTSQFKNAIAHFELLRRTTFDIPPPQKIKEPHQRYDSLILAETARFELAGDCSLTDFESAPL